MDCDVLTRHKKVLLCRNCLCPDEILTVEMYSNLKSNMGAIDSTHRVFKRGDAQQIKNKIKRYDIRTNSIHNFSTRKEK